MLEAVREHARRITSQGTGEVVLLYTPAHTDGISADAYADAAAKVHLSADAKEPALVVESRPRQQRKHSRHNTATTLSPCSGWQKSDSCQIAVYTIDSTLVSSKSSLLNVSPVQMR